jgi:hypothetical protein
LLRAVKGCTRHDRLRNEDIGNELGLKQYEINQVIIEKAEKHIYNASQKKEYPNRQHSINLEVGVQWVDPGRDGIKCETGTGCDLIREG